MSEKFIAYFRVSTQRQGSSGLGLEAQREAVTRHVEEAKGELLDVFTEVESGRKANREQLNFALEACRKHKAVLLIAKLDRLSRSLKFIATLLDSKVKFVACDMPAADRTFLQMAGVFAEWEARMISERTKNALAAAKRRGVKLGQHGKVLAKHRRKIADQRARRIAAQVPLGPQSVTKYQEQLAEVGIVVGRTVTHRIMRRIKRLQG